MAVDFETKAALALAEATNCGYGGTGPDGKWCRILCDHESLHPTMERNEECDCRKDAKAVLALVDQQKAQAEK